MRRLLALAHAVVADDAGDAQPVLSEYASAAARLRRAVALQGPPAPDRVLVAPERERKKLALVGEAGEALHRDESFDLFELRPELRRELQVFLLLPRRGDDFEDHRDHGCSSALPSSARMSFAPATIDC